MTAHQKLRLELVAIVLPSILIRFANKPENVLVRDSVAMAFDYADAILIEFEKRNNNEEKANG